MKKITNYKPTTLDEAVYALNDLTDDREKKIIKEDPGILHHGLMRDIRNEWGLWNRGSGLWKFFARTYGIGHADDMSGMIQEAFLSKLTGRRFDPKAMAASYQKYWQDMGVDPVTQKDIAV